MKPEEALARPLSIRQPYVEAMVCGTQVAEHRGWPTHVRERVYLYAALKLGDQRRGRVLLPRGVIAGSVELVDCRPPRPGRVCLGARAYSDARAGARASAANVLVPALAIELPVARQACGCADGPYAAGLALLRRSADTGSAGRQQERDLRRRP
jgi:hypothetical protein